MTNKTEKGTGRVVMTHSDEIREREREREKETDRQTEKKEEK